MCAGVGGNARGYVVRMVIWTQDDPHCIIGVSVSEPLINVINMHQCLYVCVVHHSMNIYLSI